MMSFPGDLCPMVPAWSQRYNTNSQIKAPDALPFVFAHESITSLDGGLWTRFIHPEGNIYWYHTVWRILVNADLMQPDIKVEVENWCFQVGALIKDQGIKLPSSAEIVLEPDPASKTCNYYVASREERTVGWLTECSTDYLHLQVHSEAHLKSQLEYQFWKHVEDFPMHAPLPPRSAEELLSELAFSIAEDLTTPRGSTAFSTPAQNQTFYELLNSQPKDAPTRTWLVARIWLQIAHARPLNHYGEHHARLDRTSSLEGSASASPAWMSLISRTLLPAQSERYTQKIRDIWGASVVRNKAATAAARAAARRDIARRVAIQQLRMERAERHNLFAIFICLVMRISMIILCYLFSHWGALTNFSKSNVKAKKRPLPLRLLKNPIIRISNMIARMRKRMLDSEPLLRGHYMEELARVWEHTKIYPRNDILSSFEVSIDPDNNIGRGGYGMCIGGTFLGRFPVALKLLWDPKEIESDECSNGQRSGTPTVVDHGKRRLYREVEIWKDLNHTRILPFIGLYVEGDKTYMVSPYMQNGNAREYARKHPGMNCLRILLQVAEGLEYLHGLNAVHGDICASSRPVKSHFPKSRQMS
ncbi:hypothetical protein BOTBODRAFT_129246 [Botryobasidium botryosum FD-172 SS1]|uniref:Protein kinase domain-containing protein n=1 Tax=Botryobasidium botryosum (strain FD-172 SS1) TaxID=930990 RepID=A0A067MME2_BOTB1|nr:hypothetical protein BOTBODRAFT_129246 [Botryobasidium botryosum FD-172 SS1]